MQVPTNPGGPLPPSLDAANFGNFTPQELKDAAKGLKMAGSPLEQDQILTILQIAQLGTLDWEQVMQLIDASDPNLPVPSPNPTISKKNVNAQAPPSKAQAGKAQGGGKVAHMVKNIEEGNPWLNASPMVAFSIAFQEFMKAVSKMKLLEGEVLGPLAIKMQTETALAIGENIKESAKIEAQQHINAAICAGVSAGVSLAGGIAGALNALGKFRKVKDIQAMGSAITSMTTGVTGAINMVKEINDANSVISKSVVDAQKALLDALLHLVQKRGSDSSEALQNLKEMYSQLVQAWTQMAKENIEAHRLGHQ